MNTLRTFAFLLLLAFLPLIQAADTSDATLTDRAIQFTTYAYTGVPMENADWMTDASLNDPAHSVLAFGGLASVVAKSTKLARENGGLKSVEVMRVKQISDIYEVVTRVRFFNEKRRAQEKIGAPGDWYLFFQKENGVWKIPKRELLRPFMKNGILDMP